MKPVLEIQSTIIAAMLGQYSRVALNEKGAYRLSRIARSIQPHALWHRTFRTPDGLLIDLDLSTYPDCCMAYGLYELNTARLIKRVLRPGDRFVDGGANIGYFTLLASKCMGVTGRVYAFEPQPDNRRRLMTNLKKNGFVDRVTVYPHALGEKPGRVTLHFYEDGSHNHGATTLFAEPGCSTRTSEVQMVRMDEILASTDAEPIRLVKLDIEGAEPLAISGMTALLQSPNPPQIIAEYNPMLAQQTGFAPRELVDRLLAIQPAYQLYWIGRHLRQIAPKDLPQNRYGNIFFSTTGGA